MLKPKSLLRLSSASFLAMLLCTIALASSTQAQTERPAAGPEVKSIHFEIKLTITGRGKASKITATCPFPIEWPEQKVEIVKQDKTDPIRKISFKPLTKAAKQMVVKVNRLNNGEVAQATIIVKADRTIQKTPDGFEEYQFAKKIPGNVKQYLRPSPYIESGNREISKLAKGIVIDEDLPVSKQVEEIYRWVRKKLEYKFDPKIHTCMEAVKNGHGDCEELSSLFIAVCRARGIPSRAVWVSGDRVGGASHTYPEFYLEDKNGEGHWIPCQAAGEYEFGKMTDIRLILQKGDRFKLPGRREVLRYIEPSLVGDAPQGLGFDWSVRPLTEKEVSEL